MPILSASADHVLRIPRGGIPFAAWTLLLRATMVSSFPWRRSQNPHRLRVAMRIAAYAHRILLGMYVYIVSVKSVTSCRIRQYQFARALRPASSICSFWSLIVSPCSFLATSCFLATRFTYYIFFYFNLYVLILILNFFNINNDMYVVTDDKENLLQDCSIIWIRTT